MSIFMLTLCHGPDLVELADHLLETLKKKPLENPLTSEKIVVNNYGMEKWLSTYAAEREGIVANWEFFFVAEKMWSLIRRMEEDIPEELPSESDPMTWSLMYLLDEHRDDPALEQLQRYIQDDDPDIRRLRSWKLCRRIAGVFDQYLIFRPQMILDWENNRRTTNHDSGRWQMRLWQLLAEHWKQTHQGQKWIHRAQIQDALIKAIDSGTMEKETLPDRIIVFGVPCMPPPYIQTFVKLSRKIDVCVYMLNDIYFRSENPLVASLGKEGRDYEFYFSKYIEEDPEVECERHTFSYRKNPPVGDLLLDHVRRDLVRPEEKEPPPAQRDDSVQVHSCHSPLREVEVLYDQVLAILEEDKNLVPSDILIMAPDMETYAPAIDAVFGTPEEDIPYIPYTISDRGATVCGPLTNAFIKLMRLPGSRFRVTQVIEFLGMEPVREAFEFSDEDLNRLERWIKENRIRWGIDGDLKKVFSLPETRNFTWAAGMNRMMLGYAMKEEGDRLFRGIYPYREVESLADAELMGTFTSLMRLLFDFHGKAEEKRTLTDWSKEIRKMADRFMPDTKKWLWELSQLRQQISRLAEMEDLAGFGEKVPYRIVRSFLEQKLSEQKEDGGLMGRGITFSSLAPVRSIPFKVIGMIGMDDGVFPCPEVPVEFDLMAKDPRPGDRSRREDERHIFLETILSAGQVLYFSYVGQSNRQDAEFAPSVVLQEMLDYIENRFGISSETLVTKHRLQAFSPWYFTKAGKAKKLFSYSALQEEIARGLEERHKEDKAFIPGPLPEPDKEWKSLSVRELVTFYQHPVRFLLRNRLDIYLEEEDISAEDREPFSLSGLEAYHLGQEMLDRYLRGEDPVSFKDVAVATDMLPQGWPGEEAFRAKLGEVRQFGRSLEQVLDTKRLEPVEVNIELQDFRLTGRLDDLYSNGRMVYRYGRARAKDLIDLWIHHLVLQVVNPPDQKGYGRLFARDSKKPFVRHELEPVPPGEARNLLETLLGGYRTGLMEPLPFSPNTSFAYAEAVIQKEKDPDDAAESAFRQWLSRYGYGNEGEDPYNYRIFGRSNPLELPSFRQQALAFWKPYFEALSEEEE